MLFSDLVLPSLEENLALDEALLARAEESGGEWLRLWEWPSHAVVLGAAGKIAEDVEESACRADRVPSLRRSSGGGTVLLGPGCLLFSLVLDYRRAAELTQILPSYRYILGHIGRALKTLSPDLEFTPPSDLARAGRKVSGNSQQRKRGHLLHHGTLLYDFDLGRIERYLHLPKRQPDYRAGRTHAEFLTNLNLSAEDLKKRLREWWRAEEPARTWPEEAVRRLVEQKYARAEWTRRR
jgi:lipoate-protein ligase A